MNSPSARLRAIFDTPGWARFVAELRAYRDAGRPFPDSITLASPTEEERRKLASLLRSPRPSQASRLRYDLAPLSRALATAHLPHDWAEITDSLCGPTPADLLARRATEQAWLALWPALRAEFTPEPFSGLHDWLEKIRRDAVLRKIPGLSPTAAATLLRDAVRLLALLPLSPPQTLPRVAAWHFGNSHALDPDRPLSNLILRALASRSGVPVPLRARARRELWENHGVICDELSAPVLTLNLALSGEGPLVRLTALAQTHGLPLHLSTRLVGTADWAVICPPPRVFVCENPAIVALAADALGPRCAPLVCVDGEPKTAACLLLRSLRERGAELFYHGDFDWAGLAIANRVFTELGARPWRYDAEAYHQARHAPGRDLYGSPQPTPWSPGLRQALCDHALAFDEESLFDALLPDLDQTTPPLRDTSPA